MHAKVNTLVICGYGTNSQNETAHTARLAGSSQVDLAHFSDILSGKIEMTAYQFIIFPGGFLDGDNLGAAQAAAIRWRYSKTADGKPLLDGLKKFLANGGLLLGICNGFQLLVKLGVLPGLDGLNFTRSVSLGHNDSGKFEDRWVRLKVNANSPCIFTKGLPQLYLPVRHGEGKVVANEECLKKLEERNLIALQYCDENTGFPTMRYPQNPNGSPLGIAGITDPTGHILGLMPHPEAFHHVTNHPLWTRGKIDPPGTLLFVNAVKYLANNG